MFNLRMIQANYGDCFILEYGTPDDQRFLLVDGGPYDTYEDHLREELERITNIGGRLDAVCVSHVDSDHITGIIDLLAEIRNQRANSENDVVGIDDVWHNSFSDSIDVDHEIADRVRTLTAGAARDTMHLTSLAVNGIDEGNKLRIICRQLDIPINSAFPDALICTDDAPSPLNLGNLSVTIVGPSKSNLAALRDEWKAWLDRFESNISSLDLRLMRNADQSIPNLSSVMFLAEADGRTILMTGDGRSDHLYDGLSEAGLLDEDGKLHLDIMKVMHHGSDRNVTKTFFKKITADTYVLSANGHPDNPDLSTLIWIVESAHAQGRDIELIFTNRTRAVWKLEEQYPPAEYGYSIYVMPGHYRYKVVPLAE